MSILQLHEIAPAEQVLQYFVGELRAGNRVAERARETIDFTKGRFLVALPEGADLATLPGFDNAGYLRFRHRGAPTLAHVVSAFLAATRGVVLLQDTQVLPGDAWLQQYKYGRYTVACDGEIYWRVSDPKIPEEDLTRLVLSASFYPFSAFFGISEDLSTKAELKDGDVDRLVNEFVDIAVGVFDEESFLLWWKRDIEFPTEVKSP